MKIYRYEDSLADIATSPVQTCFLAGPTVRGNQPHLTSWRFEAIKEFEKQGFQGSLIVPEFTSKTESDKGKMWVPAWEFAGLSGCDVIMFWVPRTKELIGLTTNHEHGFWLAKKPVKCVYGHPDDAYRMTYLDLMWQWNTAATTAVHPKRFGKAIQTTLKDTVKAAIATAFEPTYGRERSIISVDSPYGAF